MVFEFWSDKKKKLEMAVEYDGEY